jgi:hypothetical protein
VDHAEIAARVPPVPHSGLNGWFATQRVDLVLALFEYPIKSLEKRQFFSFHVDEIEKPCGSFGITERAVTY